MILLLGALVAAIVGIVVVESAIRNSTVGFVVALAPVFLSAALPNDIELAVGPVNVSLGDLARVVLAVAFLARLLRARRLSTAQLLIVATLLLGMWSVARGVGPFGVQTSLNEFRRFLSLITAMGYASTLEPRADLLERFGRTWVGMALALAGLSIVRWVANAGGVVGGVFGNGDDLRVVNAAEALIVVQGLFIVVLAMEDDDNPRLRWMAGALALTGLLLQHRTTWMVAIFLTFLLVLRRRDLGRKLLAAAVVGVIGLSVLVMTVGTQSQQITEELQDSATNPDTLEWRIEGWAALLRDAGPEDVWEQTYGRPFGAGWDRASNGIIVTASPHNQYIEAYLRTGVIGLVILLSLFWMALRNLARKGRGRGLMTPETLFVLTAGLPIYMLTYHLPGEQGLVLGVALAAAGFGLAPQPTLEPVVDSAPTPSARR